MELEYNNFILPFVISAITTALLGIYALRREVPSAKTFALLMLALTIWTSCYVIGLSTVTLEGKIFWLKAKYLGSALSPVVWFVFSLQTTHKGHWLNRALRIALTTGVLVTWIIIFTNGFHHWMWTEIFLVPGMPEEYTKHGFFFLVYSLVTYLLIFISIIIYIYYYWTSPPFFRRQGLLLILGALAPVASRIIEDVLGIDFIPQVDEVILSVLFSAILFALAIFRYGALNILPIAQNLVVQNISAGIVVLDIFGRVVELNPYAQEQLGTIYTQAVGRKIADVLVDWPDIDISVEGDKEVSVRRGDDLGYFLVQVSKIKGKNDAYAGSVIVLFDITARKNAELQLESLAQTLRASHDQIADQAKQLELQNEYLKENVRLREEVERISRHDLKTPVNSIISVSRLLREQKDLDDEDEELLSMVERAGYRLLNMVNLSLDLFKMEQGTYRFRPRSVDMLDLLQKVVADIGSQAITQKIELCIFVNGAPVTQTSQVYTWSEELLCYSIAANLLKNALEASPEECIVTISITTGEEILLNIHNQGAVPEAIRTNFFEKYSTAGKTGGTGLGTYSARLMARIQKGDILMHTSEDEGTTLTWRLQPAPVSEVPALTDYTNKKDNLAGVPISELPALKVLVVDDDEYNLLVMRRYLPSPPFLVQTAVNGHMAIDVATQHLPDVIFMDLEMPVMNGFEATARLREKEKLARQRRCVIIGLSAHDDEEIMRRSLEAGCDLYLTKPVTKEEIQRALLGVTGAGTNGQSSIIADAPATTILTPAQVEDPVCVDIDLRDSLPSFLQSRREAIDDMTEAVTAGNIAGLQQLAHRLAGSFALYGFRWASGHCQYIERESENLDQETIENYLTLLRQHLTNVPVRFIDLSDGSSQ
jgi:CheY-like chemotaxis protein/signal transduction histidine kinase